MKLLNQVPFLVAAIYCAFSSPAVLLKSEGNEDCASTVTSFENYPPNYVPLDTDLIPCLTGYNRDLMRFVMDNHNSTHYVSNQIRKIQLSHRHTHCLWHYIFYPTHSLESAFRFLSSDLGTKPVVVYAYLPFPKTVIVSSDEIWKYLAYNVGNSQLFLQTVTGTSVLGTNPLDGRPEIRVADGKSKLKRGEQIMFIGSAAAFWESCSVKVRVWDMGSPCNYIYKMLNMTSKHLNFTIRSIGKNRTILDNIKLESTNMSKASGYPTVILEPVFMNWDRITYAQTVGIDERWNYHLFYCMRSVEITGSQWHKLMSPFDVTTWLSIILSVLGTVSIVWYKYVSKVSGIITTIALITGQGQPRMTIWLVVLCAGYKMMTSQFENVMTSSVVSPLPVKSFPTLGSLLDAGYKIYFPFASLKEFYSRPPFKEFMHAFIRKKQYYRWNTSFVTKGEYGGKDWWDVLKQRIDLKLATDVSAHERDLYAQNYSPLFCMTTDEPFFVRTFEWLIKGVNHKPLANFIQTARDYGFHKHFYDNWRLNCFKYKVYLWRRNQTMENSYISMNNAVPCILILFGVCMVTASLAFLIEKVMQ